VKPQANLTSKSMNLTRTVAKSLKVHKHEKFLDSLEQFKNFEIKGKVLHGSIMGDIVQIRKVCVISALTWHTRKQFSAGSRKTISQKNAFAFIYHLKLCCLNGYLVMSY
jgi:hypothetical protein